MMIVVGDEDYREDCVLCKPTVSISIHIDKNVYGVDRLKDDRRD